MKRENKTGIRKREHVVGRKRYDLVNHLENVLATVSDKKLVDEVSGLFSRKTFQIKMRCVSPEIFPDYKIQTCIFHRNQLQIFSISTNIRL
jgi:hypothetical protein